MMDFTYLLQPPKRYTFEQPKLKQWVEKWCVGKVLNLFAGKVKLNVDEYRVDLDKTMLAGRMVRTPEYATDLIGRCGGKVVYVSDMTKFPQYRSGWYYMKVVKAEG